MHDSESNRNIRKLQRQTNKPEAPNQAVNFQKQRRIQDSRRKSRDKNQDSSFKISRIKIKIQDSRFKNEEKTQSR